MGMLPFPRASTACFRLQCFGNITSTGPPDSLLRRTVEASHSVIESCNLSTRERWLIVHVSRSIFPHSLLTKLSECGTPGGNRTRKHPYSTATYSPTVQFSLKRDAFFYYSYYYSLLLLVIYYY
jgi:hypothetical protein